MQRLGGFQRHLAWKKYGRRWRLMPNKQPNQLGNVFKCTPSRPRMCPLAAPLPSLHAQPLSRRGFFWGAPSSQVKWLHTGRTLPSAQVVCYSCWLWKLLVFLFFKAQTCFSVQQRPTWAYSRFIGLWNAQRCICTQGPRFDHLRDPRQYVKPCSSVRLRCLQCVAMATSWGSLGGLENSVVIYFDCHPICQFSFGDPNAPEILKRKAIYEIPK